MDFKGLGLGLGLGRVVSVSNGQVSVSVLVSDDEVSVSVSDDEAETPSLKVTEATEIGCFLFMLSLHCLLVVDNYPIIMLLLTMAISSNRKIIIPCVP